jgi:hypothetical protein
MTYDTNLEKLATVLEQNEDSPEAAGADYGRRGQRTETLAMSGDTPSVPLAENRVKFVVFLTPKEVRSSRLGCTRRLSYSTQGYRPEAGHVRRSGEASDAWFGSGRRSGTTPDR